jgi:release factor glutamine methyltransferase
VKTKEWQILDIINWSKDYFEKKNVDSPRLTIELILCNVLNLARVDLYTSFDKPLKQNELDSIKSMINKRIERIPLQYIFGQVEFYDLNFFVNSDVLIPRPETEEIVDLIIKDANKEKELNILDIGTGSGCIALSLASKLNNANINAIDFSIPALKIAKQNKDNLNIDNVKLIHADIIKTIPKKKYDIVVSNPPYISTSEMNTLEQELTYEPEIALTDYSDGLEFYRRFVTIFKDILSTNGMFYLEINNNLSNEILKMFRDQYDVELIYDISENPRIIKGSVKN